MAIKSIGIDIRDAHTEGAGKSRYALELTRALLAEAPNLEFHLFTNRANPYFPGSERVHQTVIKGRGPFWHWRLKRYLQSQPVDFFLAPTSFIYPAIAPKTQKLAIVVHDLIAVLYAKTHAWLPTLVERLTLSRAIQNSRLLICVSRHTAKDLAERFHEAHRKSVVIAPPAVSPEVHGVKSKKMALPERFLLGVGTLNPRKNFTGLFEAFAQIADQEPELHVVIAGSKGWKHAHTFKSIPATLKKRIHFMGYVSPARLNELYSRAQMLVFPSLYEGFGIPPLEAMACGCPVVASNRSSVPEVVGQAAIQVDPENRSALIRAIWRMLDPKVRDVYKKRGFAQAARFSWQTSARRILAAMD